MTRHTASFRQYRLSERYDGQTGRVFMTGTQALVRIALDQARRDRRAGFRTAGFVSGYRGSPLGALDLEFWKAGDRLEKNRITFMPAVNEDLGATAILGAQRAVHDPDCKVEGVFSMWYGKGPGLDRSGDAMRHGNAFGSAPKGGVLVVAGDDHGCVSSSMPFQSDAAFLSWFMPVLNPASVGEYLEFGEFGYALSRFSGTWVGFKAISETVESGQSLNLKPDRNFTLPQFTPPAGGLHVRAAELPGVEIEARMAAKLKAVEAFVNANPVDHAIYGIKDATFGFVTTGKAHLDLMEALRLLGLNEQKCRALGIDIYKVGMVWPLARRDALDFVREKREVLVIEEKRGIIESQFKEYFYDWPGHKPQKMVGKFDSKANPLIPWTGELNPLMLVPIVASRLERFFPGENLPERARALCDTRPIVLSTEGATRTPFFCSGCPHNTSTRLPEGSSANSGIGCHAMASWMDRDTGGYAQMGGEGVPWVAISRFNGSRHVFQNMGDGTWYHSGSLAIRQAVAAKTNITFKILFNDAVAMTGGQPIDGPVSVAGIAQTCRAEGVERIAVVSDVPGKFSLRDFPRGCTLDHRARLDGIQRELREFRGVSVLIYEQTCATEKRRRRKRDLLEDPKKFAFINELVCEGCGDCSQESNCLSIEPVKTPLGRKRRVNLSSCNKDFTCLDGFCPSFVTVQGGERRKKTGIAQGPEALAAGLPSPAITPLTDPYNLLVTGVGGTGVVTVGALITMAAHLENKGASVLDFTGFAQKFGTVLSHIRLAARPNDVNQVRIIEGGADAVIGCDVVVSSSPSASVHYRRDTKIALNLAEMPTGDIVLSRDADLCVPDRLAAIRGALNKGNLGAINANDAAEQLLGDSIFANVLMLGFAWQSGLVPLKESSLKEAIALNAMAVAQNERAFDFGRVLAANPELLAPWLKPREETDEGAQALISRYSDYLSAYQDTRYAASFKSRIDAFCNALPKGTDPALPALAATGLFRLMAIKDEYEVARLFTETGFEARLKEEFQGPYRVHYHMAPPLLPLGRDRRGWPVKRTFGPWLRHALKPLARMRHLRGTWFDPLRLSARRAKDAAVLAWYIGLLDHVSSRITTHNGALCRQILASALEIRGFGPVREAGIKKAEIQAEDALKALDLASQ
ncbi:MAG: indolepyruvate ferredoxin oxidoreductase family protein [Paracoccaceae bacterium]